MAKAGDSINNPVTGERIIVLQSGQETAGKLFVFELSLRAHAFVNAEHIHPIQEEAFEVTRGTIRFRINGQELDTATGQKVVIPPGTRHILWNASDEEASMTVWLRPALKTETAFETLFGLARDGKTNKRGLPNIFQAAVLLADYPETQLLLPSPVHIFLKLLTPLARLLGYRSSYPQYSSAQPHPAVELPADSSIEARTGAE
jgi:quercetin dioxygenase-like cupin family protein